VFYKVIEDYSDIVADYSVFKYRRYGSAVSLNARLEFIDGSVLYIKDYLFLNGKRKYSYHWQDSDGNLMVRWDNSPHYKDIYTFPHHKHLPDKISESKERNIGEIFKYIRNSMLENRKIDD